MGSFNSKESKEEGNLSLDKYIASLQDYKEKAAKVFGMSSGPHLYSYVLEALQYAIDVAQGKGVTATVTNEQKVEVLKTAEDFAKNALSFHNKFAQVRKDIEERSKESSGIEHKNEGPGLGQ